MRKKSLHILILLGSGREDGNSTRLAFAFADAASGKGHVVQSIRVPALTLHPCDGCNQCWKPATVPCVIRDDMDSVYPLLRDADVLVFATPLHFYTWSTPLKMLFDRLYALSPSHKRNLKGKKTILMASASDDRSIAFSGLKSTYRLMAEFMGWNSIGEVLVPHVTDEGDIARSTRHLAKASALGNRLA